MITRIIDADGVIQVVSVGKATRSEIDDHYRNLRDIIATLRAEGKPVRVLSDQTRAVRLSDDTNLYLKEQIERTYQPGDRLALLMPSQQDKLYARSVLGVTTYAVFESRIAAEIWLAEPTLPPPSDR